MAGLDPMALAQIYTRYFTQDFAKEVMSQLSATYPLDTTTAGALIEAKTKAAFENLTDTLAAPNAASKFVFECAKEAISQGLADPESETVWRYVSELPSLHHDEIQSLIYQSAKLYNKTMTTTIQQVICKDAEIALETLGQKASSRLATTETGGTLQIFDWGILNDGMWLNAALLRAYNLSGAFRPGDPVVGYYAQTAFTYARRFSVGTLVPDADKSQALADMTLLMPDVDQGDVHDIVFNLGRLDDRVREWERAVNDAVLVMPAVMELSALATHIEALYQAMNGSEQQITSSVALARLEEARNVVSLCLAAFAAVRETRYATSLILSIAGDADACDVVANADVLPAYEANGGSEGDLIRFGLYFHPTKGVPVPSEGYKLSFLLSRRDGVLSEMMADDVERQERQRNTDTRIISQMATEALDSVVSSYLSASKGQMTTPLRQATENFGRMMASENPFNSVSYVMETLSKATGMPFVNQMTMAYAQHIQEGLPVKEAQTQAILDMAIADAMTALFAAE